MLFKSGTLVIVLLYLGFVSLGLPDQSIGIAWPFMRADFEKPVGYAGILVSATMAFTVISSYFSGYVMRRLSVQAILIVSSLMTAGGTLGYALSPSFYTVLLFTIPLGLGAGTIDAALNSYVADNFSPFHMNMLHAFWGVGAASGPLIITWVVAVGYGWRGGYLTIAFILFSLTALFVAGRKSFVQTERRQETSEKISPRFTSDILMSAAFFFLYTATESGIGVWFYSVLVEGRSVSGVAAGTMIASYWVALTAGRIATGVISRRIKGKTIITALLAASFCGILLLIPDNTYINAAGLIVTGAGLSGLYPMMMSETPKRFHAISPSAVGYQVGSACLGVTLLVPLTGFIIQKLGLETLPIIILPFVAVMFLLDRRLKRLSD